MQEHVGKSGELGVIIVLYRSADVIGACLSSVIEASPAVSRIVLVDNASPDESVSIAEETALGLGVNVRSDGAGANMDGCEGLEVDIIRAGANLGFAGGVNIGIDLLLQDAGIDFFWVLNPDCELAPGAAEQVLATARDASGEPGFALLGTRVIYHEGGHIQSDGGVACRWTGRCRNLNQGCLPDDAILYADDRIDFISGASMIASRGFIDAVGLLPEDYFLYYEEVAWAADRGDWPLIRCLDAAVLHHGGTAIGSGGPNRAPSALSNYFNFRNRMRFVRRTRPWVMAIAYTYAILKILQTLWHREWRSANAAFRGMHELTPPHDVASAIGAEAHERAFAKQAFDGSRRTSSRYRQSPA